jgi:hypothetical protein
MKFTAEKPTQPGWYWWQHQPSSPYQQAGQPTIGLVGEDEIFHCHRFRKAMADMPSGRWSGPLEPPA